jgi:site-specific DNA-methyltransferase (adenine-specific)
VISDPPFDQEAHTPARRARSGGLHQNMPLDFAPLDPATRRIVATAVKGGCTGWFIAFCQTEQVAGWRDEIEAAGLKYKTPMVWVKPDAVPKLNGQGPAIGYESMVTAWCGDGYARWNGGGKRGVFTYLTNPSDRVPGRHMTEKPVLLMRELVMLFTNHGQLVCDPFMGSGTTGVASVALGRRFVGIEIDAKHFDTACRRVEAATKQADLFIEQPKPKAEQLSLLSEATP